MITLEVKAIREGIRECNSFRDCKVKIRIDCREAVERILRWNNEEEDTKSIQKEITKTRDENRVIIITQWIPAHFGIEGNEEVDILAKEAVDKQGMEDVKMQIRDPKQKLKDIRKEEANRRWRESKYNKPRIFFGERECIKKFIDKNPVADTIKVITGHCLLNNYLHKVVKAIEDGICKCGKALEMAQHFVFECEIHKESRYLSWGSTNMEKVVRDKRKVLGGLDQFVKLSKRFELGRKEWFENLKRKREEEMRIEENMMKLEEEIRRNEVSGETWVTISSNDEKWQREETKCKRRRIVKNTIMESNYGTNKSEEKETSMRGKQGKKGGNKNHKLKKGKVKRKKYPKTNKEDRKTLRKVSKSKVAEIGKRKAKSRDEYNQSIGYRGKRETVRINRKRKP